MLFHASASERDCEEDIPMPPTVILSSFSRAGLDPCHADELLGTSVRWKGAGTRSSMRRTRATSSWLKL
eukprot:38052-Eustigmatos_ZCMA.PRE.1